MNDVTDQAHAHDGHGAGATDYAGAIYGSILATSLIGGLRQADVSSREITLEVGATIIVFWLAHTWAAVAGERIHLGHGLLLHRVRALARHEWPIVEAGFVPVGALVLGWIGILDATQATRVALFLGVGQLFIWGFVLGRRVYDTWRGAILAALGDGAVGVVLVLLEIWITH